MVNVLSLSTLTNPANIYLQLLLNNSSYRQAYALFNEERKTPFSESISLNVITNLVSGNTISARLYCSDSTFTSGFNVSHGTTVDSYLSIVKIGPAPTYTTMQIDYGETSRT
jgi:AraC-like DNA-binding protein